MNAIKTGMILLNLLPVITDVVKQVEAMDKTAGNGKHKLQLALTLIEGIYNASAPTMAFADIRGKVTEAIAAVVVFYNTVGAFIKAVKAA